MTVNWHALFVPDGSLLEIFIRGTIIYFVLLAALRVLIRRHIGSMSLMDLLVMVLIADAAQNAMAGDYTTITEGLALCGTLIGWNYFLDWASYQSPFISRLLEPPALIVVRDGKLLRRNMRREFLTEEELKSQLREQGIEDLSQVKRACIEPDGAISIARVKGHQGGDAEPKRRKALF